MLPFGLFSHDTFPLVQRVGIKIVLLLEANSLHTFLSELRVMNR